MSTPDTALLVFDPTDPKAKSLSNIYLGCTKCGPSNGIFPTIACTNASQLFKHDVQTPLTE